MELSEILLGAVVALAGVIARLFFIIKKNNDDTSARLADCESDREELWKKIAELSAWVCVRCDCKERMPLPEAELGRIKAKVQPGEA